MTRTCPGRRLSKSVVFLILAALAVTASGVGADINLVLNPGFENPQTNTRSVGTGDLANWSAGSAMLIHDTWTPHSGTQSLSLNAYSPGWISQDLVTVAGGTYDLSFFMSGDFVTGGTARTLEVFWGGASRGTVVFTRPSDWATNNMGWTLQSGGVLSGLTASGPSTELKFVSLAPDGFHYGPALDDISVTSSVPEPASASLLLLALPGLAWLRLRRRA